MARCYQDCKYNLCNVFCNKYNEPILSSRNFLHRGLLIHPLHYLSVYYYKDINVNVIHLIEIAEKHLEDNTSKGIIEWYKQHGNISYNQRKFLVSKLLYCFESK
jgi:hypothetical protein